MGCFTVSGSAMAKNKNTEISLKHMSPTEKAKLVRTLRDLAVAMEKTQVKRTAEKGSSSIGLRFFSSAMASDTQTLSEEQKNREAILSALLALHQLESELQLEKARKQKRPLSPQNLENRVSEAKDRLKSLAPDLVLTGRVTLKANQNNYRTKRLKMMNALSALKEAETTLQAEQVQQKLQNLKTIDPRLVGENEIPSSRQNGSLQTAQPTSAPFTPSPCIFAGGASQTIQIDGRPVCKRPDSLRCTPPGQPANSGSSCGPLFTMGKISDCLTRAETDGFQKVSQVCADKYPPLTAAQIEALQGENLNKFNTFAAASLHDIEATLTNVCSKRAETDRDCKFWTNQYATAVQLAHRNDDNKKIIGVDESLRKFLSDENKKIADLTPEGYSAQENSDRDIAQLLPTTPANAEPPPVAAPATAAPAADAEPVEKQPESLMDQSACDRGDAKTRDTTKPQLIKNQPWAYQCIAKCNDGSQLMFVTKRNLKTTKTNIPLEEEVYLVKIRPNDLANLREANEAGFNEKIRQQSLFGCNISSSPKNFHTVSTLAKAVRENVSCDQTELYVKAPSVIRTKSAREDFRNLGSDTSQFYKPIPRLNEKPYVKAASSNRGASDCGISHNTSYNKKWGKNTDTIEWKVEDTQSTFPSMGSGKDLMKCTTKANQPGKGISAYSNGAIVLSYVAKSVIANENWSCLNADGGAYPTQTAPASEAPVDAPSGAVPETE